MPLSISTYLPNFSVILFYTDYVYYEKKITLKSSARKYELK